MSPNIWGSSSDVAGAHLAPLSLTDWPCAQQRWPAKFGAPGAKRSSPAPALSAIERPVNDEDWPIETTWYAEEDDEDAPSFYDAAPTPPPTAEAVSRALHEVFGFPGFRGVQDQVVGRVLEHHSTLAVMPTGAGKSLTYQLPAVMLEGTCVVVSPLIALMHDQLRSARANGIRAAALTSADADRDATMAAFRNGELDLLYVAPERASQAHFRELLSRARIALFAIDEAHCVSEWGHDFRPDYRLLRPLLDSFPHVPRLALTATADRHTRADILTQLGIPDDGLIIAGFDRPNIRYTIRPRDNRDGAVESGDGRKSRPGHHLRAHPRTG